MSVTAPLGFRAGAAAAGLKTNGDLDVAVVVNDGPLRIGSAVFTTNRFQAAPVLWSKRCVADGQVAAVALNSGGANACTGPGGLVDARRTADHTAGLVGCKATDVAVCSTGLIGVRLPMKELLAGIEHATRSATAEGGELAARAIMTTDTRPKRAEARGGGFRVGGMAKGAGMLAPELATMLVVITTDAVIDSVTARQSLAQATGATFDRVDSDGCMSTNDTVVLMSSGSSGVAPARSEFQEVLEGVCDSLSEQLVGDAEGASKDLRIEVVNAASVAQAVAAAKTVARSSLLKCAIHGQDANWGRVLSALGTSSAEFDPDGVDVAINGVWVCRGGSVGEDRELVDMRGRDVTIEIDLNAGTRGAVVRSNDLTADYVHENSRYST